MRLTMLTVFRDRFSAIAVILIVRVPNRPSRPKMISISSMQRGRSERGAAAQRVRGRSLTSQGPQRPILHSLLSQRKEALLNGEAVVYAWPKNTQQLCHRFTRMVALRIHQRLVNFLEIGAGGWTRLKESPLTCIGCLT
jgi:hypothetical protein